MPFITKHTIEKINDTADMLEVIQQFVDLKKSGASWKGLSPFGKEKTGSFMVTPSKGVWKCFSTEIGGNSAVGFLMKSQNFSYPEALEWLANKYSIKIEYETTESAKEYQAKVEKQEALRPLLEAVISKYEEAFKALPEDHPAKVEVYGKRKYTDEIVDAYRIGYAPGGNFIYDLCKENGRVNDAVELGLISDDTEGRKYRDKWSNRAIYPLIEKKGSSLFSVGLAGRRLDNNDRYAKWMNSKESELFHKGSFWYGMDKAKTAIVKHGEAWILEGYNDVIAWQTNGIPNAIASSGTAISSKQRRVLRKLCDRIVFCFDPDNAGKKSMLKYIPEFIKDGFRVELLFLYPAIDPDDFVRYWNASVKEYSLADLGTNNDYRDDGFKFLMTNRFDGKGDIEVAQEAKHLVEIISYISDDALAMIYLQWLSKESGVKITDIKAWLKEVVAAKVKKMEVVLEDEYYRLPKSITTHIDKLRPTIEKYQMFQDGNQIWVQRGGKPPFDFVSVSNFQIEIIQHMQDEKFPMKLLRIRNIYGLERIFDIQSSEINKSEKFENAVTAHGNFRWKGGRNELELLKTYLFDQMGTGRKIDVLGWQPEGFWVWNNKVTVPGGEDVKIDENGVFVKDDVSYYVPSANQIYRNNLYKYEGQKKVVSIKPKVTFQNYTAQVIKVHREHGMMGILFSIASIFQDIVVSEINSFPMLFLYGPPSSGKDLLAECCQSFFGRPQTAINLESGASTIKAQVREFAQFCNLISHLSEFKNGDPKLDGILKGLWGRLGYKRGNIDSYVGTESIPILSSTLMTGNFAPDQEALITRLVWNMMDKTSFTDAEVKEYEKLNDMTKKGISGFTDDFLRFRERVSNNFQYRYREFKATLSQRHEDANSRMLTNLAVLGTFYQMFQNDFNFPFTQVQMLEHFDKIIEMQMNKMNSASIINRFWNCFLASMRGTFADQIRIGRDFKLEGDKFYFNFTSCFNRVQRQWYTQYKDNSPAKGVMMESLKKDDSYIEFVKAVRMAPGKISRSTSAYVVNINKIPVSDEIMAAVEFQVSESSSVPSPATPIGQGSMFPSPATPEGERNINGEGDDLPF